MANNTFQSIPGLKGKIGQILSDYINDMPDCETCCDRVMEEIESGDIVKIAGDTELLDTVKENFGDAAILRVSVYPEEDVLLMEEATVNNAQSIAKRRREEEKQKKIDELQAEIDAAIAAANNS